MNRLFTLLLIYCAFASKAQICIHNTSSLQFDGISTYVSLASNNNLDVTDSITVEAWIKASTWALSAARGSIVCNHGWYSGEEGFVLRAGGTGELSFNIACDSAGTHIGWREVVSNLGVLQLNTWYHVAATFDGDILKLYINGVLVQDSSLGFHGAIVPSLDYNLSIGRLADANQPDHRYWTGNIDEVRIWHRVLSAAELAANMNMHIDAISAVDLAGYYRLNENMGTTAADLGSGHNNGTVTSGTWSINVPFIGAPPVPIITNAPPNLYSNANIGNQWYLDSVLIPGATATAYTPTQNGSYTVIATDGNGCSASSAPVVITTLSIGSLGNEQFKIIHYPSAGILTIEIDDHLKSDADLQIFDVNGNMVVSIEKGSIANEIDVHTLSAGIYVACLRSGGKLLKQKFVIN